VKKDACIPLYPEMVSCTDEIDLSKVIKCLTDASFKGIYRALEKIFK
jgi:hypothetical protein